MPLGLMLIFHSVKVQGNFLFMFDRYTMHREMERGRKVKKKRGERDSRTNVNRILSGRVLGRLHQGQPKSNIAQKKISL